jgi:hypothetical protein
LDPHKNATACNVSPLPITIVINLEVHHV